MYVGSVVLDLLGMGNFFFGCYCWPKHIHQRSTGPDMFFTENFTHSLRVVPNYDGMKNHFQIYEPFVRNHSTICLCTQTHAIVYYPKIYVKNGKNYIRNSYFSKNLTINLAFNRSIENRKRGTARFITPENIIYCAIFG